MHRLAADHHNGSDSAWLQDVVLVLGILDVQCVTFRQDIMDLIKLK